MDSQTEGQGISPGDAVDQTAKELASQSGAQHEAQPVQQPAEVPDLAGFVDAVKELTAALKEGLDVVRTLKPDKPVYREEDTKADAQTQRVQGENTNVPADAKSSDIQPDRRPMYREIPTPREIPQESGAPQGQPFARGSSGPKPRASFSLQPDTQGNNSGGNEALESVQKSATAMQKALGQLQGILSQVVSVSQATMGAFEASQSRLDRLEAQVSQLSIQSRSMATRTQRNGRI